VRDNGTPPLVVAPLAFGVPHRVPDSQARRFGMKYRTADAKQCRSGEQRREV
jgi:hypothetical protein